MKQYKAYLTGFCTLITFQISVQPQDPDGGCSLKLSAEINNTWWRSLIGGASGFVTLWLARLGNSLCLTVCACACVHVCVCSSWFSEGIPQSPALSGSSTALLQERCSQEGRPNSSPLISNQQEGFIGLIKWLFAHVGKKGEPEYVIVIVKWMWASGCDAVGKAGTQLWWTRTKLWISIKVMVPSDGT